MYILFGWYSFLLKAYSLKELDISADYFGEDARVEVRQKCFHLFWIPFFGLGKICALRKAGKLEDLPPELESLVLPKVFVPKTPWYTYIGFMIIALGFILYTANEKIETYKNEKLSEEDRANKHAILANPIEGDVYTLRTGIMLNDFYARVSDVRGDSVLLKIIKMEKRTKANMFEPEVISFKDENLVFKPQWTTREELINAAPIDSSYCNDSLQLYIPELGGVIFYEVNKIERAAKAY